MRASILLGLSLCLAFTSSSAFCQSSDSVGGVRTHIEGIEIPPIANAPFTAKVVVTWNQPLVGGGTASRKYYTQIARDSQGRVRRETRGFVPANSDADPPLRTFTILDPVSSTRTVCTNATMNCATSPFQPRVNLTEDGGTLSGGGSKATRESLGQQTMLDLPVVGTHETVAELQGSTRLSLTQIVAWYSPDLHIDLSVDRNNPQLGEVTLKVSELVQGEPDPSLLAIPPGYRVIGNRSN
jgi:hypothetical protein